VADRNVATKHAEGFVRSIKHTAILMSKILFSTLKD